jgi:hypothetical protein
MSKKVMKLLDRYTGRMECKVCGREHYANIRPRSGGRYYRGSWQCLNGCKLPEQERAPDEATIAANTR